MIPPSPEEQIAAIQSHIESLEGSFCQEEKEYYGIDREILALKAAIATIERAANLGTVNRDVQIR